jgi:hypothetical protein
MNQITIVKLQQGIDVSISVQNVKASATKILIMKECTKAIIIGTKKMISW